MIPSPVQLSNTFSQIAKKAGAFGGKYYDRLSAQGPAAAGRNSRQRGQARRTTIRAATAAATIFSIASSRQSVRRRFARKPQASRSARLRRGGGQAGYILTNNHVVDKAGRIQVKFKNDPTEYRRQSDRHRRADGSGRDQGRRQDQFDAVEDRQLRRGAGGRLGAGHRLAVRLPGHGDGRHHQRQGARSCRKKSARPIASSSISCRPTRPSIPATAAARCSISAAK